MWPSICLIRIKIYSNDKNRNTLEITLDKLNTLEICKNYLQKFIAKKDSQSFR